MITNSYKGQVLETIARKALKGFDETLLIGSPRAIPIEEIVEQYYGLSIEYHYLRNNGRILGQTVFSNSYIPVYDIEKKKYTVICVKGGTIILDMSLLSSKTVGRLRFTCAHELAHWLIHQELYLNSGESAAMIKGNYDDIIEGQADFLGSSLLMPMGQVKKVYYSLQGTKSTAEVIAQLANLFEVSKQAMEIRLKTHNLL